MSIEQERAAAVAAAQEVAERQESERREAEQRAEDVEDADAVDVNVHKKDALLPDEIPIWREAAKTLTPVKTLEKITEHNKFIISTVATIGTILTGFGAVTAAVTISRTTYTISGIPVVPAGALLTSALSALSVAFALFGRRITFKKVNANNLVAVKRLYTDQINRSKGVVQAASWFFTAAAFAAAATAIVAGLLVVFHPSNPRNLATMSASVGADGAVTIKVGGTIDGLGNDDVVSVKVFDGDDPETEASPLINLTINPDKDGIATISGETKAPAGSSGAIAVIDVTGTSDDDFTPPTVTYPDVKTPDTPSVSANQATLTLSTRDRLTGGSRTVGHLGGTIGGIEAAEAVRVTVVAFQGDLQSQNTGQATGGTTMATASAYPSKDGVVAFNSKISPVPAGSGLRATITVHKVDDDGNISDRAEDTYVIKAPALR